MSGPDFHELVGEDLSPEEADRLRHVHDLLLAVGPPPELPPSLAEPPGDKSKKVAYLPRRRVGALLLIAAALAAAVFGVGYYVGGYGKTFNAQVEIPMHGTSSAAEASLALATPDRAGNRPIQMVISGLPDLGEKGYYELFLTRGGKRAASCGTFVVHAGKPTTVKLNAPYVLPLDAKPGWIVVSHLRGTEATPTLLTT
jgi:hypothetical protein